MRVTEDYSTGIGMLDRYCVLSPICPSTGGTVAISLTVLCLGETPRLQTMQTVSHSAILDYESSSPRTIRVMAQSAVGWTHTSSLMYSIDSALRVRG